MQKGSFLTVHALQRMGHVLKMSRGGLQRFMLNLKYLSSALKEMSTPLVHLLFSNKMRIYRRKQTSELGWALSNYIRLSPEGMGKAE